MTMKFLPLLSAIAGCLGSAHPPDTCLAAPLSPSLVSRLAAVLSPSATIVLPSSPLMQTTHLRWQAYAKPTYSLVVEVATEQDVVATVPPPPPPPPSNPH